MIMYALKENIYIVVLKKRAIFSLTILIGLH